MKQFKSDGFIGLQKPRQVFVDDEVLTPAREGRVAAKPLHQRRHGESFVDFAIAAAALTCLIMQSKSILYSILTDLWHLARC